MKINISKQTIIKKLFHLYLSGNYEIMCMEDESQPGISPPFFLKKHHAIKTIHRCTKRVKKERKGEIVISLLRGHFVMNAETSLFLSKLESFF